MPLRNERAYEVLTKITFQRISKNRKGHRNGDTRQPLPSVMFVTIMRIKRTMVKIALIEN